MMPDGKGGLGKSGGSEMMSLLKWLIELRAQRRANKRKILVENRPECLRVFNEFAQLFYRVQSNGKIDQEDLLLFKGETYEARWLFGQEIPAYAEEVLSHGRKYWLAGEQLKEIGMPHDEREKLTRVHAAEEAWLFSVPKVAPEKFRKYLDISS
jgi:hypothetical protein